MKYRCELCSLAVENPAGEETMCPRTFAGHRFLPDESIEALKAAYAYVDEMVPHADDSQPLWYSWALRHAYLRGLRDGRK